MLCRTPAFSMLREALESAAMARRPKSAVRRYHDRVAGRYDASYDDVFWQWHDALTWDHLKAHLPSVASAPVLDLGCGTGKWGLRLAKSGYAVTSVDISGAMVEQARRKFEAASLDARATFVRADLCELSELPRRHYALAVALGDPIGCTTSPAKALKQIHRCLSPGGLLVATFDNRWAALDFYLDKGSPEEFEEFLRTGRTHWLTRDAEERFPIHTYSPGQVARLLERAGFEIIDLVGKTVLPMRHHRHLLADAEQRRQWMKLERRLWRDPAAMGRAAHLQVVGKVDG